MYNIDKPNDYNKDINDKYIGNDKHKDIGNDKYLIFNTMSIYELNDYCEHNYNLLNEKDWSKISKNKNLTLEFIEKFKDKLHFHKLLKSGSKIFTCEFIDNYYVNENKNWDFNDISNQVIDLNIDFINAYIDKDWNYKNISKYIHISEITKDIVNHYHNPVYQSKPWDWDMISLNDNLTKENFIQLRKYIKKKWNVSHLCKNEYFIRSLNSNWFILQNDTNTIGYLDLLYDFLKDNELLDKINYQSLSNINFNRLYYGDYKYNDINYNVNINKKDCEFILYHKDKPWDMYQLSIKCDINFIENYFNEFDWDIDGCLKNYSWNKLLNFQLDTDTLYTNNYHFVSKVFNKKVEDIIEEFD